MNKQHRLLDELTRRGPSSTTELHQSLGYAPTTIRRILKSIPDEILAIGNYRARRYAKRRPIQALSTPISVYEGTPHGDIREIMTLQPVEPNGYYIRACVPEVTSGFVNTDPRYIGPDPHSDLPWFLHALRPEGFLGRALVKDLHNTGQTSFPADLTRWSGDDILRFASTHGTEHSGALLIGPHILRYIQHHPPRSVQSQHRHKEFPRLADEARTTSSYGTSPGGEQPKFSIAIDHHPSIVKFSPPTTTSSGRRWADLLFSEAVVSKVLRERDIPAARSTVIDSEERRFLQVKRFDRIWTGAQTGRRGMCSLFPFDLDGTASELRSWSLVTKTLVEQRRLSHEEHRHVQWLEELGHLIANTDMHLGNMSVYTRGTQITGLAPVYDMLPMALAPRGAEIPHTPFDPRSQKEHFQQSTCEVALEIWDQILAGELSEEFRPLAAAQRQFVVEISRTAQPPSPRSPLR